MSTKRKSARGARGRTRERKISLGRDDWIAAARAQLIAAGVNAVKIGPLARRLRVTRGSFYWHFTSRADLLRELLKSWELTNTVPFERSLANGNANNGVRELATIMNLWLAETEYSPAFDTAVRDWARVSAEAATVVARVDERRIAILHRIFKDLGFGEPEALVRARIAYFHQVGYYALEFQEERKRRLTLAPYYMSILSGVPVEELQGSVPAS
jgi:AcrR family transcriptional regulator